MNAVALVLLCMLTACGNAERTERETEKRTAETEQTLLLLPEEEEIRSMWVDQGEVYVFTAQRQKTGKVRYRLCMVKDGALTEDTKYAAVMEECREEALEADETASYEYEAGFGRNHVVYFLGRDEEGAVRKCYWLSETYYADIPFYKLYENQYDNDLRIETIEIGKSGTIYLAYNSLMRPYDHFYRGVGLGPIEGQRFALSNLYIYELVPGRIYRWDINEEYPPAQMIECDTLTNGEMPYFIDSGDNIYIAGSYGLSYLPYGGSIWEVLLDTGAEGFDSTEFVQKQIWVDGKELYLMGQDPETKEWKILRHRLP